MDHSTTIEIVDSNLFAHLWSNWIFEALAHCRFLKIIGNTIKSIAELLKIGKIPTLSIIFHGLEVGSEDLCKDF